MGSGISDSSGVHLDDTWTVVEESRGSVICLFCGGASCKRENWELQQEPSAIRGLHSSWITDDVLAMQRPSSRLLREFGIIAQFQKYVADVRSVTWRFSGGFTFLNGIF